MRLVKPWQLMLHFRLHQFDLLGRQLKQAVTITLVHSLDHTGFRHRSQACCRHQRGRIGSDRFLGYAQFFNPKEQDDAN